MNTFVRPDALAAEGAAGNAAFAREVEKFATSTDQTIARIDAQLAALDRDLYHLDRELVSSDARAQRMALQNQRALAVAAGAKIAGLNDLQQAFVGDRTTDPPVQTTFGDQISLEDMRSHINDARSRGTPEHVIQQDFLPNPHSPAEVAQARADIERLLRDPRWTQKINRGDPDAWAELQNLSRKAKGRDDEPNWSPPL